MKVLGVIRSWCGGHKKITATLAGSLLSLVPDKYLPADSKKEILATLLAYLVGQGVADMGKEAAKIQAAPKGSLPLP